VHYEDATGKRQWAHPALGNPTYEEFRAREKAKEEREARERAARGPKLPSSPSKSPPHAARGRAGSRSPRRDRWEGRRRSGSPAPRRRSPGPPDRRRLSPPNVHRKISPSPQWRSAGRRRSPSPVSARQPRRNIRQRFAGHNSGSLVAEPVWRTTAVKGAEEIPGSTEGKKQRDKGRFQEEGEEVFDDDDEDFAGR